jgi:hypothetical protein
LNEEVARYFCSVDKIITRLQVPEATTLLISMNISDLLQKPLWQMTGEEFMFLSKTASQNDEAKNHDTPSQSTSEKKYVYGIDGIAEIFGCSRPTASRIKKSGRINAAIRQIGRKIVVDVELALSLVGQKKEARRWTR